MKVDTYHGWAGVWEWWGSGRPRADWDMVSSQGPTLEGLATPPTSPTQKDSTSSH